MRKMPRIALSAAALTLVCSATWAQSTPQRVDMGKREFNSSCAACHGQDGKGNGSLRPFLTKSPSDLTTEAKRNGGVFPMDRLYQVIDGASVAAHGTRDMPVWGRYYRIAAAEHYGDVDYDEPAYVRGRILALLEYINRLQVK